MKVCNVVKDSIWYDPRVKKQIYEYINNGIELYCVGVMDPRYNEEEVKKIPCKTSIVKIDAKYYSEKRNFLTKIIRECKTNKNIYDEIVKTKADIIHANDLNALIPAYIASKKINSKLIYDTHEIFVENLWIAENKIVKFIWESFEKYIIRKVDKVICVSNAAAEYISEKYKIEKPLVITNSVRRSQCINQNINKKEILEVLNHGQFYPGRGYDIMVDSAILLKKYDNIQLVLRGFGHMEKMLKEKVEKENIDNVRFAPPVNVEELIPEASNAWIGVALTEPTCLNFKLSVSNKIFEYAAAGLPVIMSDIPEHRYLNERFKFGVILESNTPECFAKAIKQFYDSKELYSLCSENAKIMSNEISWESQFDQLIKIEKELMRA